MSHDPTSPEDLIEFIIRAAKLRMLGNAKDATLGLVGYLFEKGYPVCAHIRWMEHRMWTGKGPIDSQMVALVWERGGEQEDLVMDLRGHVGWDAIFEYRKNELLKISPNATRDHSMKDALKVMTGKEVYARKGLDPDVMRARTKIEAIEHKTQAYLLGRTTVQAPARATRPRF